MRIVITGGAGFLGRHVASELRDLARARDATVELHCVDLVPAPHVDRFVIGDVTDGEAMRRALRGADVVIHMASLIDWGTLARAPLERVNVRGTETVIEACRSEGVKALIYTSSMDVLLDGRSHEGVDESAPYPERFQDHYCATKARAEQLVLAADGAQLRTCALRPCGMFGENDPYHLDNVLRAARKGLPFRIGAPEALFQHVYVGNVAFAHALAAFAILEPAPRIRGRAYFCTDEPAQNFFDALQPFVEAKGYRLPARHRRLPDQLAYGLGALAEGIAKAMPKRLKVRPKMTRSSVLTLTRSFSVASTRLADDLGYKPRYSPQQAFERTMAHYAHHDP